MKRKRSKELSAIAQRFAQWRRESGGRGSRISADADPGVDGAGSEHVVVKGEEPGVDNSAQRPACGISGGEPFTQAPIDGLEVMERGLSLADLHLGGGEALRAGPLGQPSDNEGLAAAVLASHGLETGAPGGHRGQLLVEGTGESIGADGERIEPPLGDGAAPKGINDLAAALR